jgi:hypothetical protein
MFRDTHPLEVAVLFLGCGILFGTWFCVKLLATPSSLSSHESFNTLQFSPEYPHDLDGIKLEKEISKLGELSGLDTSSQNF